MARPSHLTVACYDISRDNIRRRVASILETRMVRVQGSVYEGVMDAQTARTLYERAMLALGVDDNLRFYQVPDSARSGCHVAGGAPLTPDEDYWMI